MAGLSVGSSMSMSEPREEIPEWIAVYCYMGRWRLITREVSKLSHATKLQKKYADNGYETKLIKIV
jgi:hypothetical protein